MDNERSHFSKYITSLLNHRKNLSGIAGVVDFRLLSIERQNIITDSEPICKSLSSTPYIWTSKSGSITIGCFARQRPVGDVIADEKFGFRVLTYTGNLGYRKKDIVRILSGDETLIKDLNEIFSLVLWNQTKFELSLITDRYGTLPIYYQYDKQYLFFGSEIKTILVLSGNRASLNREVLDELLWFGCPLTEQTLFQGITKVAPATILKFSPTAVQTQKYWNVRFCDNEPNEKIKLLDQAEQAFGYAVKRAGSLSTKSAIALTGGIDTRIMLAEVINQGIQIDAFTAGLANSADMKSANRLHRYLERIHHKLIINEKFLNAFKEYAKNTVWLSDGQILLQDNQLIYLNEFCRDRFDLLVDGGCIEISKRGPLRRISRFIKSNESLCEILMNKWGNNQLQRVFYNASELKSITSRIRNTLEILLSQVNQTKPGDTIDAFFLRVVWPNRYGPQVALQNQYLDSQLPFLDYKFMDAILKIPCTWRERCLFHFYVITKCAPRLKQFGRVYCDLLIPWTDNYYLRYLLPAFNLVWRKLKLPSFDRPNFAYPIWWRNELKESVKTWMNSLTQRGILNPRGFDEIIKPENINKSIFDIAASRLGMFEVWCENFLDTNSLFN